MKLFPESAYLQLEFNKVKELLANYCQTEHAHAKALELRIHTRKEFVETDLRQYRKRLHRQRQNIMENISLHPHCQKNLA